MTRILWHGIAPWQPTGYGQQTAIWASRIRDAGYELAVSAQGGASTCEVTNWRGIPVFPSANNQEAVPLVSRYHLDWFKPDLVITLYDGWQMIGEVFKGYKTLAWLPVDTTYVTVGSLRPGGVAAGDRKFLEKAEAIPVAMSRHGQAQLAQAGYPDCAYVPHGIDTRNEWAPLDNRQELRSQIGIGPDTFAVGICGTNIDPHRKSMSEQFLAFSRFHVEHPDSVLLVHSSIHEPGSLHLDRLASGCGIPQDKIRIAHQAALYTGTFPQSDLRAWYSCLDVLMGASHGEGFGLTALEAQACGTPVILIDQHTGPELVGPGWLVESQPFWNWTHEAWWHVPLIDSLTGALEKAFASAGSQREAARDFAEDFDTRRVWPSWEAILREHAPPP